MIITDPVLATQVLRNKAVDKLRFMYSFLDVVRASAALGFAIDHPCMPCRCLCSSSRARCTVRNDSALPNQMFLCLRAGGESISR